MEGQLSLAGLKSLEGTFDGLLGPFGALRDLDFNFVYVRLFCLWELCLALRMINGFNLHHCPFWLFRYPPDVRTLWLVAHRRHGSHLIGCLAKLSIVLEKRGRITVWFHRRR